MKKLKAEFRRKIQQRCRQISLQEKMRQTDILAQKFLALAEYKKAQTVAFYFSLPDEVSTLELVIQAEQAGKQLVFPRLEGKNLEWHVVKKLAKLVPGKFGILEPAKAAPTIALSQIDLMVVPGVAFDRAGNRLGRGLGYYDRVLEKFSGKSVALAFDCQLVDEIPMEEHDQKVGKVLTVR